MKIVKKAVFFGGTKWELHCQTCSNSAEKFHDNKQSKQDCNTSKRKQDWTNILLSIDGRPRPAARFDESNRAYCCGYSCYREAFGVVARTMKNILSFRGSTPETRDFGSPKMVKATKNFICGFSTKHLRLWWWCRMKDHHLWSVAPVLKSMSIYFKQFHEDPWWRYEHLLVFCSLISQKKACFI